MTTVRSGAGWFVRWIAALLGLVGVLGVLAAPAMAATTPTTAASRTGGTSSTVGTAAAGPSGTAATDVASVAAALAVDPVYVSTAPGTPDVVGGDIRGALPPGVTVAVLPASAAGQVGGEAAALPGAILGKLPRAGSVLVLAGSELDGASRTQPYDQIQQALSDARTRLASGASRAQTLVLAARDLAGTGQLSDPPAPSQAGSPSGSGVLWVSLAIAVIAVLSIPLLLRRSRRPATSAPPRVLRDRVEVDAYGRITRRVTAQERATEHESGGERERGGPGAG